MTCCISTAPPVMDMMNGDDDVTGESGFGTGADYDSRDLWKQAMKSPPPGYINFMK